MPLPTWLLTMAGGSMLSDKEWFSRGSFEDISSRASQELCSSLASRCKYISHTSGREWYSRASGGN